MVKLSNITMGAVYQDSITGIKGKCTAKLERIGDNDCICLEGVDSTGRAFQEWPSVDRVVEVE